MSDQIKMTPGTNTVIISRKEWLRGGGEDSGVLWDPISKTGCCLGHACKQIYNLSWEQIDGGRMPADLFADHKNIIGTVMVNDNAFDTKFSHDAADINDDCEISDEVREYELIELFASNNLKLIFVECS